MGILNFFTKPEKQNNTLRYYSAVIQTWLQSNERKQMLLAEKYYRGEHDILHRQRTVIDEFGKLSPVENLPNNKLVDNQYRKLVDQKTNFALGKPMTISTSNPDYLAELNLIFDKNMFRQLKVLGQYTIDGGISWLYPHYDETGKFKIRVFPSYEICPIWSDGTHTELVVALRYYSDLLITSTGQTKSVDIVEIYTKDGIDKYVMDGGKLSPHETEPHLNYMVFEDEGYNWERLPIIPFKYNTFEIPLITNVKSLQDSLNQVLSDFQNNMEEDPRSTVLVLKNYDGTDLSSFRRNLATFGVVKVHTIDGVQGGIDTLKVEVDAQNYQLILMQLKRALVENGRGFDAKEERMDGDPNQMNIESMYSDIDLDVNSMESEFQAGFEQLKWFIDKHLVHVGKPDYSEEKIQFVFNKNIFINENGIIENCVKSVGIISNKTILSKHPWVSDLQRELNELELDEEVELEKMEKLTSKNQVNDGDKNV